MSASIAATGPTRDRITRAVAALPLHDRQDFDDATRGFVGRQLCAAEPITDAGGWRVRSRHGSRPPASG